LVLSVHIGASSSHVGLLTNTGRVVSRQYCSAFSEDRREMPYDDLLDEAVEASMKAIGEAIDRGSKLDCLAGFGLVVPAPVDDHASGQWAGAGFLVGLARWPSVARIGVESVLFWVALPTPENTGLNAIPPDPWRPGTAKE
jgi:hypothetical protein